MLHRKTSVRFALLFLGVVLCGHVRCCYAQAAMELAFRPAEAEIQDPETSMVASYTRVNIALARRCCELTDEQERKLEEFTRADVLAKEVETARLSPVKLAVAGIARFLGGRVAGEARARQVQPAEMLAQAKSSIDGKIMGVLDTEQQATFRNELEEREKFRRESQAAFLVAVMDQKLFLQEEQRATLTADLIKCMEMDLYWQLYAQNSNYIPDIPQAVLKRSLDAGQLSVVNGMTRYNYQFEMFELQNAEQQPHLQIEK